MHEYHGQRGAHSEPVGDGRSYGNGYSYSAGSGSSNRKTLSHFFFPALTGFNLITGSILFIAGFSAPYWMSRDEDLSDDIDYTTLEHYGLWLGCKEDETCINLVGEDSLDLEWHTFCQVLMTIALVFDVVSVFMVMIWLISSSRYTLVKKLQISQLILAVSCMTVGVILFGRHAEDEFTHFDFNWCFYLVCIATALIFITVVMLIYVPSHEKYPEILTVNTGSDSQQYTDVSPTSQTGVTRSDRRLGAIGHLQHHPSNASY